MKRFTVLWHPLLEGDLTEIWINAGDPHPVEDAANQVEQLLSMRPESAGEQISNRGYQLEISPLHLIYRIHPEDRTVRVVSVLRSDI